jgi:PKD repeat protein
MYTFKVDKLENTQGAWFIKSFKWILEDKEFFKEASIEKLNESSEVSYKFSNYGKQVIKVVISNTAGKSNEIRTEIDIPRKLWTNNLLKISENDKVLEDIKYNEKTREYSIFNVWVPTTLKFDAKYIRPDSVIYWLDNISWDLESDGIIEGNNKILEQKFDVEWTKEITVNYTFVHKDNKNEIIHIKDKIIIECIEKDAIISFEIKPQNEYAPTIVAFDASVSKVKDENIVKFIYDYGDGVTESRDAINPGHKYLTEWNYLIKLTVVTEKWKEYSTSKSLILKAPLSQWKITVSLRKAPINQEIDFLSTWSIWQIVWYHWDFWDGNTSNEANPSYAYQKAWKYKVVLTLEYMNNNIITVDTDIEIIE